MGVRIVVILILIPVLIILVYLTKVIGVVLFLLNKLVLLVQLTLIIIHLLLQMLIVLVHPHFNFYYSVSLLLFASKLIFLDQLNWERLILVILFWLIFLVKLNPIIIFHVLLP